MNGNDSCTETLTFTLEAYCPLIASFTADTTYTDPGGSIAFSSTSPAQPGINYRWYVNGHPTGTGEVFNYTFAAEGSYGVAREVCNSLCCTRSATLWVRNGVCETGREGSYWIFGRDGEALIFTDTGIVETGDDANPSYGYESSAVACDDQSNLLFYSNGSAVYNRNHQRMVKCDSIFFIDFFPNSPDTNLWNIYLYTECFDYLAGCPSTTQIISVRQPGSDSLHYLFYGECTRQGLRYTDRTTPYSIPL